MSALTTQLARGEIEPPAELLAALGQPRAHSPLDPDRVEGMLLGLAIGDALGNTSESMNPDERRRTYGEIRDYLPNRNAQDRPVGLPSDDTQLAFWTLEHVLEHGRIVPETLAATFADGRRIFGMGATVRAFLAAYQRGAPWYQAAQPSAGNGAVMRIAPVLIPHLARPSGALWRDAILGGAITHNDPSSIGACVATVGLLWDSLAMKRPPDPHEWLDRYVALARPLEGEVLLQSRLPGLADKFQGPIWKLVEEQVRPALGGDLDVVTACNRWYSGAFLLETMPSVLYILARHANDPQEAILRAVNDTRDNDTIASIVGAVMGALHGRSALPERWIRGLLGRTREDNDGDVFRLITRTLDYLAQGEMKHPSPEASPEGGSSA